MSDIKVDREGAPTEQQPGWAGNVPVGPNETYSPPIRASESYVTVNVMAGNDIVIVQPQVFFVDTDTAGYAGTWKDWDRKVTVQQGVGKTWQVSAVHGAHMRLGITRGGREDVTTSCTMSSTRDPSDTLLAIK